MNLSLDMSISREDFFRLLPTAVGLAAVDPGDVVSHTDGLRRWTIHLEPLADRRLGSVILPRHRIELGLEGYSNEEVEAFMVRFHRGFQRGGG